MSRVDDLNQLVRSGRLKTGAVLYHDPRRNPDRAAEATVQSDGVRLRGKTYRSLSTAARAITGYAVNGWTLWKEKGSGQTLDTLRREGRR